jgi:hypothetical protein
MEINLFTKNTRIPMHGGAWPAGPGPNRRMPIYRGLCVRDCGYSRQTKSEAGAVTGGATLFVFVRVISILATQRKHPPAEKQNSALTLD